MTKIKITETGEIKTLSIKDPNGIDWTNDCIGNADALHGYDEETNSYEMSQEDFEWWENYLSNLESDEEKLFEYKNNFDYDSDKIYDIINEEFTGVNDYGDHHSVYEKIFERIENEL